MLVLIYAHRKLSVPVFIKSDLFEHEAPLPVGAENSLPKIKFPQTVNQSFHQQNHLTYFDTPQRSVIRNQNTYQSAAVLQHCPVQLRPTSKPMLVTLILLTIYDVSILTTLTLTGFDKTSSESSGVYQKLWPVLLLTSKGVVLLICIWVSWVLRRHAPQLSSPTNNALLSCAIQGDYL